MDETTAPASVTAEVSPPSEPVSAPDTGSAVPAAETPSKPPTLQEVFADLKGEDSTGDETPKATEAQADDTKADTPKPEKSGRQTLQQIAALEAQGRLHELDPQTRGEWERLRKSAGEKAIRQHEEDRQLDTGLKETYLELLRLENSDDPGDLREFNRRMRAVVDGHTGLEFYEWYRRENPHITLESPDAKPVKDETTIRKEVADTYVQGFERIVDALIADEQLSEIDAAVLKNEFQWGKHPDRDNLSRFTVKLVNAIADKRAALIVEKRLPEIRKAERMAALQEAQTQLGVAAKPPTNLRPTGSIAGQAAPKTDPERWSLALNQAREEMARSGNGAVLSS